MNYFYRKKTEGQPDQLNQIIDNKGTTKTLTPDEFGGGAGFKELSHIANPNYNKADYTNVSNLNGGLYGIKKNIPKITPNDLPSNLPDNSIDTALKLSADRATIQDNSASQAELLKYKQMQETQTRLQAERDKLSGIQDDKNEAVDGANAKFDPIMDKTMKMWEDSVDAFSQTDFQAKYDQLQTIEQDIVNYGNLLNDELDDVRTGGRLYGMATAEKNSIKQNYTSKIYTAQASMSAIQGNMTFAFDIIDKGANSVKQITITQKSFLEIVKSAFSDAENDSKSNIFTLESDQKEQINNLIIDLETEEQLIEDNKTKLMELMRKNPGIAHGAGLTFTDTEEEWTQKIVDYYVAHPEKINNSSLTFEQKLKLYEKGLVLDGDGSLIEDLPLTGETVKTAIGSGIITAYGSDLWEHGLDIQLEGGKGAGIPIPFDFEILEAGENKGFGNQVKVRTKDGQEIWLSHLDKINSLPVGTGEIFEAGTIIGTQGNTGKTLGPTGVHVDITMPKPDGGYWKPHEVAKFMSVGGAESELSPEQILSARQLAITITKGKGTTEYKQDTENLILEKMKGGQTLDQIEDELRYSGVSSEFIGNYKGAFEFITKKGFSRTDRESAKDGLDELLEDGDTENAQYYLMGLARDKGTAEEKKHVVGREEALLALADIEDTLARYIESGGSTGLITGNVEKFQQSILKKTGNAELARIGNEISVAIQTYRHAVSGAAFTESESKQYEAVFPSIGKSPELNNSLISSIRNIYERNQTNFYRQTMGAKYFDELFKESDDNNDPLGLNADPLGVL